MGSQTRLHAAKACAKKVGRVKVLYLRVSKAR